MHVLTSKNKDTLSVTRLQLAMERSHKFWRPWAIFKRRYGLMNGLARRFGDVPRQVIRWLKKSSGFIKSTRVVSICSWAGLMKQLISYKKQSQRYNHEGEFFRVWHKTRF